jgi:hypothetical protein
MITDRAVSAKQPLANSQAKERMSSSRIPATGTIRLPKKFIGSPVVLAANCLIF